MKKRKTTGLAGAIFLLFLLPAAVMAQAPNLKKLNRTNGLSEIQAFESIKETPFVTLPPLTDEQKARVEMFNAYLVKACLHRLNPSAYPIAGDANSMEAKALRIVNSFSDKRFNKVKGKISQFSSPADPKRRAMMGRFTDLDLTKPVEPQMQARKSSAQILHFSPAIAKALSGLNRPKAKYSGLDFIVRALHCVDETDPESPGDDDMLITGTLYEINVNSSTGAGFFAGNYDDGDYNNFGEYWFGSYPLTASAYPKTLYCMFTLVEQDSDESGEQLAKDINNALAQVGGKICDAYVPGCSLVINELAGIVNNIMSTFFDDDYFPPQVIAITLNSEDEFGAGGTSTNLATGKIKGHDGAYKIGYKLRFR